MKKFFFFNVLLLLTTIVVIAQNPLSKAIQNRDYTDDWELFKQIEDVDIYYQYTTCPLLNNDCCEYVFFKVKNNSGENVSVKWKYNLGWKEFVTGSVTTTNTRQFELIVPANGIVKSDCTSQDNSQLMLYIRELSLPDANVLSTIEIEEIVE